MQLSKIIGGHKLNQKTAKAMAESFLSSLMTYNDASSGPPFVQATKSIMQAYEVGGIPNSELVGRALALRDQLSVKGVCTASCHTIRHPTRKRAIVEFIRPGVIIGRDQLWLGVASVVFDLTRDELVLVETTGHVAISQHAFQRLFQRSSFKDENLLQLLDAGTKWTVPLLNLHGQLGWKLGADVAIPFLGGLLLGTLEPNPHEPEQGPTAAKISQKGGSVDYLIPPFGKIGLGVMVLSINTYVGPNDLFEDQRRLSLAFQDFEDRFSDQMRSLRSGMIKGLPDKRMVERFGPVLDVIDTDGLVTLIRWLWRLTTTPDWQKHAGSHKRNPRYVN